MLVCDGKISFSLVEFCFRLIVQIEPNDDVSFSVINSSTRVTVIPEYREPTIVQPREQITAPLSDPLIEQAPKSLTSLVRPIGTLIYSKFSTPSILTEKKTINQKSKLALVPGRRRRLYRIELDETTSSSLNPTIARINRCDWSSPDDDGTGWPHIFVGKVTVYRSSKEVTFKIEKISFYSNPFDLDQITYVFQSSRTYSQHLLPSHSIDK